MSVDPGYPAWLYAAVHDGNPGDLAFYRRRCAGARAILELGCGDARILAGLTAPERTCVGLDIDPDMLTLARGRAPGLELVEGNMCALADTALGGRTFDRIILPHGGLYCVLDATGIEQLLAGVVAHLRPGGSLVLDAWAADGFHAESDPADLDAGALERVKTVEIDQDRWEVLERSAWDKSSQRIDATYLHVRVGSHEGIEGLLRQRYVLGAELRRAITRAGLELVELAGGFDGQPYGPDAALLVVEALRPA